VWPIGAISLVSITLHILQVNWTTPTSVQVGSFKITEVQEWGAKSIVTWGLIISLHVAQWLPLDNPALLHVDPCPISITSVCPWAGV